MIKNIDKLAEDWAEDILAILEKSCISYPHASTIARINEGGSMVAGPMCPEVFTTRRITAFHMVYKEIKNSWKKIIHKRYILGKELCRKEYYMLDRIHVHIKNNISI